jgi:hypothetical protein
MLTMNVRRHFLHSLTVLLAIAMAACSKPASEPVVSIQSIEPSGDVPLVGNDRITFKVTVRANGIGKPSTVGLVVQADGELLGSADAVSIEDGVPTILHVQAVIPSATSIQVITPLYVGDVRQTSIVDVRHFKIIGKRG